MPDGGSTVGCADSGDPDWAGRDIRLRGPDGQERSKTFRTKRLTELCMKPTEGTGRLLPSRCCRHTGR